MSFLGPENSLFGPKICFLPYDPRFCQRPVCSPRKDGSFPTLQSIFRLFVSGLSFCKKKTSRRAKKFSPKPHCLSITALARAGLVCLAQRRAFLAQNMLGTYRPCWLIRCPAGCLVGGCGARAVSRKTLFINLFLTIIF